MDQQSTAINAKAMKISKHKTTEALVKLLKDNYPTQSEQLTKQIRINIFVDLITQDLLSACPLSTYL